MTNRDFMLGSCPWCFALLPVTCSASPRKSWLFANDTIWANLAGEHVGSHHQTNLQLLFKLPSSNLGRWYSKLGNYPFKLPSCHLNKDQNFKPKTLGKISTPKWYTEICFFDNCLEKVTLKLFSLIPYHPCYGTFTYIYHKQLTKCSSTYHTWMVWEWSFAKLEFSKTKITTESKSHTETFPSTWKVAQQLPPKTNGWNSQNEKKGGLLDWKYGPFFWGYLYVSQDIWGVSENHEKKNLISHIFAKPFLYIHIWVDMGEWRGGWMDPYILIDGQIAGWSNETAPPSYPCVGCVGVWPAETPTPSFKRWQISWRFPIVGGFSTNPFPKICKSQVLDHFPNLGLKNNNILQPPPSLGLGIHEPKRMLHSCHP